MEIQIEEVVDVLKESRAFILAIWEYSIRPGKYKCSFDELIEAFKLPDLSIRIRFLLEEFGIYFKEGQGE